MAAFKLKKFIFDFKKLRARMQEHIDQDIVWLPATARTPGAVWSDISEILDPSIRNQLSQSVGRPLHDIYWICDYRGCPSLEIHKDNPGNEYPINSRFTIIMMLDGRFEVSLWEDDQISLIDKVVIHPGEFLVLNNSQYYHSGRVLDGVKLSLHAYPIIPEIDSLVAPVERLNVELFV